VQLESDYGAFDVWYYAKSQQRLGPVTLDELRRLTNAGEIDLNDMVCQQGDQRWVPLSSVDGLFPVASRVPKPNKFQIPTPALLLLAAVLAVALTAAIVMGSSKIDASGKETELLKAEQDRYRGYSEELRKEVQSLKKTVEDMRGELGWLRRKLGLPPASPLDR